MPPTSFSIAVAALLCSGSAFGQPTQWGGWLIEVIGEPVSPTNPTTTVRVSAYFPSSMWAFGYGMVDLTSTDPKSTFSDPFMPPPLREPCASLPNRGVLVNGGAYGVHFGQINILGCRAVDLNPLAIWEATWTTRDFTRRDVHLETSSTPWFHVYEDPSATLNTIDLIPLNQFRHGSAVIQVIPAPAGALLFGAGLAVWRRRRPQ